MCGSAFFYGGVFISSHVKRRRVTARRDPTNPIPPNPLFFVCPPIVGEGVEAPGSHQIVEQVFDAHNTTTENFTRVDCCYGTGRNQVGIRLDTRACGYNLFAEKPCLGACPVGAFGPREDPEAPAPYDIPACVGHIASPEGSDCMTGGCLARRACPVARDYVYGPDQARFHMQRFLKAQGG